MRFLFLLLSFYVPWIGATAQTVISGNVMSRKQEPVAGANITLVNTYYGATSQADGNFSFTVQDTGKFRIRVTIVGFKTFEQETVVSKRALNINVRLTEEISELQAVVVSAGTFEASDRKRNTVLKPIDIVTSAGEQADIVSALKTLPGAQQIGETEGLFVRGGTGKETKVFIDGMLVSNPFYSSVPEVAQRGRYSPLLFKGTNFSSGGYSAKFGQGLSSVLTLETHDLPSRTETNMIISSPQLTLTRHQLNKRKTASAGITVNYNNLAPYYGIVKQRLDYTKAPEVLNIELFGRLKLKNGLLKYYGYANHNKVAFTREGHASKNSLDSFKLKNNHVFTILTYTGKFQNNWELESGIGFSYNKDSLHSSTSIVGMPVYSFSPRLINYTAQGRVVLIKRLPGLSRINVGIENQYTVDKTYAPDSIPNLERKDIYTSFFSEADIYLTQNLAARVGIRYEYSSLLEEGKLAPRISLAYKIKNAGQVSLAYGDFYQKPEAELLFRDPSLHLTRSTHYLLNYQKIANNQTIRVEFFYKKYKGLVTYLPVDPMKLKNEGDGYAKGIELFWRDKKTFKDFSYWIAYSFLDTKRKFLDYPQKVQPSFAANHTLHVVMKQWVSSIASIFSATYSFASGRPYHDPNLSNTHFMASKTPAFHDVAFQVNKLITIGKVNAAFIFNVNNVLGNSQVFGYRYSNSRDINGTFNSRAIVPAAKRFYFIGAYLSIGTDRRKEIIDN